MAGTQKRPEDEEQVREEQNKQRQPVPMTPEQNMLRHQSAPKPTMDDSLNQMLMQPAANPGGLDPAAINGFRALSAPIGKEAIEKVVGILGSDRKAQPLCSGTRLISRENKIERPRI